MRKPRPTIILFLAMLFAAQTVAAMASQCTELHRVTVEPCCACCQDSQIDRSAGECDCYQAPEDPPATPAVHTHVTVPVAAVPPGVEPAVPAQAERLEVLRSAPAPTPSFLRDTDVRGPPCPR